MTIHAAEEMAEDDLDILDIEEAILNGQVVDRTKRDPPRNQIHSGRACLRW
jgi:hypothetical protein